jgi:hypothetical protein
MIHRLDWVIPITVFFFFVVAVLLIHTYGSGVATAVAAPSPLSEQSEDIFSTVMH